MYPEGFQVERWVVFTAGNHYTPLIADSSTMLPFQLGRADIAAFRKEPHHPPFRLDHTGRPCHDFPKSIITPLSPFFPELNRSQSRSRSQQSVHWLGQDSAHASHSESLPAPLPF